VFGDPLTVWSLLRGEDVLEGGRAAGAMVLRHERRTGVLLAVAAPMHLAISLGWAAVMAAAFPRGGEPVRGAVGGIVIATLDLALIGRRIPSIAALPQGRQWADHAAYGLAVGLVLRARRSRRAGEPAPRGRAARSGPDGPSGLALPPSERHDARRAPVAHHEAPE
jgi:hypothetical protein